MPYAAQADMVTRFGLTELVQLAPNSDPTVNQGVDPNRIGTVLADAAELIDGYLRSRYTLPLAVVPPLLVQINCDLARRMLYTGGTALPLDQVMQADKLARQQLADISRGLIQLSLPDSTAPADTSGPAVTPGSGGRMFDQGIFQSFRTPWRGFGRFS